MRFKYLLFFLINFLLFSNFSQEQKQNILFIGVDDLRPLLNSYGHKQMHTPNLDKLASEICQLILKLH